MDATSATVASGAPLAEPRSWRNLLVALESERAARLSEWTCLLLLLIGLGIAATFYVGQVGDNRPLSPAMSAILMVLNLIPAIGLIMLLGRRIAVRRAADTQIGSEGRLHVRLVAIFSFISAVPVLVVVAFASILFQSGVQFWFSDTARGMLENAGSLARGYYEEKLRDVGDETTTMAGDLRNYLDQASIDDPRFGQAYFLQVFNRKLSESAIIEIGSDGVQRTAAVVAPQEGPSTPRLTEEWLAELRAGKAITVTASPEKIEAAMRLYPDRETYLYTARDFNVPSFQLGERAQTVLNDYQDMVQRSRSLQLQFNLALFLASLVVTALAVWIALAVADRLVRPVSVLVHAAQDVAEGKLATRVGDVGGHLDEVAILARSFDRMTERLESQTSDLMNANDQLKSRRAFMEAVLESVSSGVLSLDGEGRILLANSAAEDLLTDGEEALAGRKLSDIAAPLAEVAGQSGGRGIIQLEQDTGIRTLAVTARSSGPGLVITFEDITQQLVDQRRAAWADVARRIAHEIKNPLTPIQLAAERLKRRFGKVEGKDGEVASQLTQTIIRQVGDLRNIVDEFSSFARMPRPSFQTEMLDDILRHSLLLQDVAHPAIDFVLEMTEPEMEMPCDRRQIGQAMTNLLKNAVEAIETRASRDPDFKIEQGRIRIVAERTPEEIVITLSDNGIGWPQERERLIEPYVTLRESGTGLGLAIVKKIVDEHFGTIELEDAEGGGGSIVLRFKTVSLGQLSDRTEKRTEEFSG